MVDRRWTSSPDTTLQEVRALVPSLHANQIIIIIKCVCVYMRVLTFGGIGFSNNGQAVNWSAAQLHIVQVYTTEVS